MADFERVKAEHPIEGVAERLGLTLKREGQSLRGPCPSGRGGDRSLVITPAKHVFFSQAVKKGGSVIDLVAFVRNCTPKEAAEWIEGKQVPVPEKSAIGGAPNGAFKPVELVHDHPCLLISGIEATDAQRFGLGYREPVDGKKRAGEGHILVPVYADGKLAGYVGCQEITWIPDRWRA